MGPNIHHLHVGGKVCSRSKFNFLWLFKNKIIGVPCTFKSKYVRSDRKRLSMQPSVQQWLFRNAWGSRVNNALNCRTVNVFGTFFKIFVFKNAFQIGLRPRLSKLSKSISFLTILLLFISYHCCYHLNSIFMVTNDHEILLTK